MRKRGGPKPTHGARLLMALAQAANQRWLLDFVSSHETAKAFGTPSDIAWTASDPTSAETTSATAATDKSSETALE